MDTTHQQIIEYWTTHQSESGLSVDWAEAGELCWRCARKRRLQRCHIVPRALGGSEEPSNLVLLCGQCHAEAPNVDDPGFMWVWLRAHDSSLYGEYWYERGFREYEFIFQSKPFFCNAQGFDKAFPRIRLAIEAHIRRTSTHWGQGKINPATIAWLIRNVELEIDENA